MSEFLIWPGQHSNLDYGMRDCFYFISQWRTSNATGKYATVLISIETLKRHNGVTSKFYNLHSPTGNAVSPIHFQWGPSDPAAATELEPGSTFWSLQSAVVPELLPAIYTNTAKHMTQCHTVGPIILKMWDPHCCTNLLFAQRWICVNVAKLKQFFPSFWLRCPKTEAIKRVKMMALKQKQKGRERKSTK